MSTPTPLPADIRLVRHRIASFRFIAFSLASLGIIILAAQTNRYLQGPPHYQESTIPPSIATPLYTPLLTPDSIARYNADLLIQWHHSLTDTFLVSLFFLAAALLAHAASRKPPTRELLLLAKHHQGLLSLSEITLALHIDPRLAHRTLKILQSTGLASQRWTDLQKNTWEFPDYLTQPPAAPDEPVASAPAHPALPSHPAPMLKAPSLAHAITDLSHAPPLHPSDPAPPPLTPLPQPQ